MNLSRRNWLEPNAAKHPMRTSIPRKFTLVDAMVVIGAIALACVSIRLYLRDYGDLLFEWSVAEDGVLGLVVEVNDIVVHLALTLSLALWLLRLRKPRPV